MPELPEVETVCRGIRPHIVGRTITAISHSGKQLRLPVPLNEMRQLLTGQRVMAVSRRAKYLLVEMARGDLLIIHLGMTGNLGVFDPGIPLAPHCHLRFALDDGRELRYTDVRRFGSLQLVPAATTGEMEHTIFATTGPEPFAPEFSADYLKRLARNRSIPVKSLIMTNQIVAGVGNIYANESLFAAAIRPATRANTISKKRWQKLVEAIQAVLRHAIECGGSTISDYLNADQQAGYFQINFMVYGRSGEPCRKCGTAIEKITIGGRASFFCPTCQH